MIDLVRSESCDLALGQICKYFGATKRGFYAHAKLREGVAVKKKQDICKVIKAEFKRADATYGSPRITGEIVDLGHSISENTVAKYMQELGRDARRKKRFRVMTTDSNHASPIADGVFRYEDPSATPTGKQGKVIFHSDRGSQYASKAYRVFLERKEILPSMSRRGNCYDNCYVESFFASLKKERIYRREINSPAEMRKEVFDYIEAWYNRRRQPTSPG